MPATELCRSSCGPRALCGRSSPLTVSRRLERLEVVVCMKRGTCFFSSEDDEDERAASSSSFSAASSSAFASASAFANGSSDHASVTDALLASATDATIDARRLSASAASSAAFALASASSRISARVLPLLLSKTGCSMADEDETSTTNAFSEAGCSAFLFERTPISSASAFFARVPARTPHFFDEAGVDTSCLTDDCGVAPPPPSFGGVLSGSSCGFGGGFGGVCAFATLSSYCGLISRLDGMPAALRSAWRSLAALSIRSPVFGAETWKEPAMSLTSMGPSFDASSVFSRVGTAGGELAAGGEARPPGESDRSRSCSTSTTTVGMSGLPDGARRLGRFAGFTSGWGGSASFASDATTSLELLPPANSQPTLMLLLLRFQRAAVSGDVRDLAVSTGDTGGVESAASRHWSAALSSCSWRHRTS